MGDALFHDWVILVNVPIRVTARLLREGTSPWFDDRTTPDRIETRDDIVRKSLRDAAEDLRRRRGLQTLVSAHLLVAAYQIGPSRRCPTRTFAD